MSRLYSPFDPRRDHYTGLPDAPIELLEYGDFECPYCRAAHRELREVRRRMGRDLRYVFRNFPLTQIHPHAMRAAETAEAAGAQGHYWEMHDRLFSHQDGLAFGDLITYARQLELDEPELERVLEEHEMVPRIREDFFSGVRSGVNGTPCFFINGQRHDGGWDARSLLTALEATRAQPIRAF